MVEPMLVGTLVWLGQIIAARGIERLMDTAVDKFGDRQAGAAPAAPIRRHDLTAPGAQVSSDLDITVRHHRPGFRTPVILTVQKFGDRTSGTTLPMVLGDTAHLTLPRAHYLFAALVIDLPRHHGDKPTLRGLGWASLWLAANAATPLTIGTQHPTAELVDEIGLKQHDGSLVFTLPPAQPEAPRLSPRAPGFAPRAVPPTPTTEFFQQLFDQQPAHTPRYQPRQSRQVDSTHCRARAWVGDKQCAFLPAEDGLCRIHRQQAGAGRDVLDHRTGQPIILP
ncbi:hypothetical protein [Amycolatopsis sp. YIM 10]|uniref:hypothetical protein n=1 Tax=Amycolatopsis sp. YIM 10 TaxID=2653857 RepID=UPI001290489B|nr:hypothetical protein [Amycolatopsis sp. YIM 10]QFU90308.1 hypothetical protein YIM_25660 [Amycolatopsis sp. YIM 10]